MADNFNINTTQDQSLIAGGLNTDNPNMTYVDFATQLVNNAQRQQLQEAQIANAIETAKQSKLSTKQKTSADDMGVNPELENYLTKEEALAYLMHEWNLPETHPEILQIAESLPEMVNRFTIQTLLRKRAQGLGKEVGEPFKAEAKGIYPTTLDNSTDPAQLQTGQVYQTYVTEDGKIQYVASGRKFDGSNNNFFKPTGLTKDGRSIAPSRDGRLWVMNVDGSSEPFDFTKHGEPQPIVAPNLPGSSLQDLQRLQTSVEQFNKIKNLFTEDAVGPIQDRLVSASQFTGVDLSGLFSESSAFDAKTTTFRTALQSAINDYIKAVTGAQMSEAEAARLQKAIPASGKAQEAFLPALEEANRIIEGKLSIALDTLEAGGYRNVAGLRTKFKERTEKSKEMGKPEVKAPEAGKPSVRDSVRAKLGLGPKA